MRNMGQEIQLELNLYNKTEDQLTLEVMQKQLDQMCESVGKVRRKLFAEMDMVKKQFAIMQKENEDLKILVKSFKTEKTDFSYSQNGLLFNVIESPKEMVNIA